MAVDPLFILELKFAIRGVNAFVGHSFDSADKDIVEAIVTLLTKLGATIISGGTPEPRSVSAKVLERIESAELFVGVFTRRDQKPDGSYTTSPWVIQEMSVAMHAGKRLLLFVEEGVDEIGGLQGDYEYIRVDRRNLAPALLKAVDYYLAIVSVPIECRRDPSAPNKINVNIGPGNLPMEVTIERLRKDKARRPDDENVRLSLAGALERNKQFHEAIAEYRELLQLNPRLANAHHQLAHLYQRLGRFDEALGSFQAALDHDPANSTNYSCFAKCLYQTAKNLAASEKQTTLQKARRLLERAMAIGGQDAEGKLRQDVFLVDEALNELSDSLSGSAG